MSLPLQSAGILAKTAKWQSVFPPVTRKTISAVFLGKRLGWQTWIPALDDSTPQTGKVTHRTKTGGERVGLKLLERIADIAADIAAVRVFLLYAIDPLKAVPLEDFRTTSALHKVRWPQIVSEVSQKRESLRKLSSTSTRSAK
jgi:hypothetical protein